MQFLSAGRDFDWPQDFYFPRAILNSWARFLPLSHDFLCSGCVFYFLHKLFISHWQFLFFGCNFERGSPAAMISIVPITDNQWSALSIYLVDTNNNNSTIMEEPLVKCPYCPDFFKSKGIGRHRKSCKEKREIEEGEARFLAAQQSKAQGEQTTCVGEPMLCWWRPQMII